MKEIFSKELDSSKLLFERFGIEDYRVVENKPQHPPESTSAFSEAVLQS